MPAVGAIDRRAFPFALKRLRFADKSRRRGAWASEQVVQDVVSGAYPPFARTSVDELTYLAYVDAVGRAKDEIVNGGSIASGVNPDSSGRGDDDPQDVLSRLSMSIFGGGEVDTIGSSGRRQTAPKDETLEGRSVSAVTKKQLEHAGAIFLKAMASESTSKAHGPRRVARRDLNPIMHNLRPALSDDDLQVRLPSFRPSFLPIVPSYRSFVLTLRGRVARFPFFHFRFASLSPRFVFA